MRNEQLRRTTPIWSEEFDTGGMFSGRLSVHEDPDGGKLPFLAVCKDGWGAGGCARRATRAEAIAYTEELRRKVCG